MFRVIAPLLLALASSLAVADSIRVYNWNDYIDPQVLADFTRTTGIDVDYHTYSTSEEIESLLSGNEPIDVAMPSHDLLAGLIGNGHIQALDLSRLPNRQHLDRDLLAKLAAVDPGNRHSLPYLWTSAGLAINIPQAEAAFGGPLPSSWSLLFDTDQSKRLASCGISLLDAPRELYSNLLGYQGHRLARTTPARLKRASELLKALRPHLRYIDNERYIDDLNNGHLCLAMAWSGDALAASAAGQPVRFMIPDEGAVLSIDSMVIPRTAQHPDLAYRFIDYLMQPEVAARITNATFYPSANADARAFIDPELRDNPALYPDSETKRRLTILESLPTKLQNTLDEVWPQVRDGH